jgi:hypothetical protein
MPESPCFETPTLADRMVVVPSTRVARRIPSKAVAQRRARLARRTRDTVGQLPREPAGSAQGRSQSTACDHHTVTSGSAIAARPVRDVTSWRDDGSRLSGRTSHSAVLCTAWLHKSPSPTIRTDLEFALLTIVDYATKWRPWAPF